MSEKVYRAAKYIRLSHTDDRNAESDSVGNQRRLPPSGPPKNKRPCCKCCL